MGLGSDNEVLLNNTRGLVEDNINASVNKILSNNKDNNYTTFIKKAINQINIHPKLNWSPHINGWYYVNMVHGQWTDELMDTNKKFSSSYTEFSPDADIIIKNAINEMGHLIKEIDPTQLNIEYETISGRVRNIQHATRIMGTSEFSITYKDNRNLDNFRYHELWYNYIEAYKKGFINSPSMNNAYDDIFIPVPYTNAIWIVIFKPLSFELQGLIKIMGVSPTGLPIKDIIGQRSSPQVTTYSINYKAVDTITMFYGNSVPIGNFYEDFLNDSTLFFGR